MKGTALKYASIAIVVLLPSCSARTRLQELKHTQPKAALSLREDVFPEDRRMSAPKRDTLVIRNLDGRDVIVMKAIRDDDGQMVASQVLDASYVSARFRNIAERGGQVDIAFRITVPSQMQDSRWQIRYSPVLYMMGDSVALDKILVTGKDYRRRQLRGYQHYRRFVDSIISDTTKFIRQRQLEIFIRRNIPALYAFKCDSSLVAEEEFHSVFGVDEARAIDHYTNKFSKNVNERRKARMSEKFRRYVKAPILRDGVRLDTILVTEGGDYVYNYVQTVATRPGLRKVDIVLSGEIFEQAAPVYRIPASEPLTFFISSLSALVDPAPRYLTKVVERKARADCSYSISFRSGRVEFDPFLDDNETELSCIRAKLWNVLENKDFCLDSIVVSASASPEGGYSYNAALSARRSDAMRRIVQAMLQEYRDSLVRDRGVVLNIDGSVNLQEDEAGIPPIKTVARLLPEDWEYLGYLVDVDSVLTFTQKDNYMTLCEESDPDLRESAMKRQEWYPSVRERLYPKLRRVNLCFHMHRRGMLKDTMVTTEPDSVYMSGVQAIRDRDYDRAADLLAPYADYNTAVAYCALERNYSALAILDKLPRTASCCYLSAILHSRLQDEAKAVECYLTSCRLDPQFVHRGNLDPEISVLIKRYALSSCNDEDY